MHVNNAPGASSFQLHQGPRRECGPKELFWLQQHPLGCHPCVCAQCKHVAQQWLCTGAAHSALVRHTRLTTLLRELPMESRLPAWPSQAAAGLTEHSQCSNSTHIHQSLRSSAQNVYLCSTNEMLHACTPAVKAWHTSHSFGLLCNCDCLLGSTRARKGCRA